MAESVPDANTVDQIVLHSDQITSTGAEQTRLCRNVHQVTGSAAQNCSGHVHVFASSCFNPLPANHDNSRF